MIFAANSRGDRLCSKLSTLSSNCQCEQIKSNQQLINYYWLKRLHRWTLLMQLTPKKSIHKANLICADEKKSIRTTLESVSKGNALKAMMCSCTWLMQDIPILARQLWIQIACAIKKSFKIPDVICNTYLMMSLDEKDVMVISCSRMVNLKAMEVASFEVWGFHCHAWLVSTTMLLLKISPAILWKPFQKGNMTFWFVKAVL